MTIGIGIIGTGFAERTQMPGLAHVPGARLAAVMSGHRENAERAAARFAIPRVASTFEELADSEDVDLVLVSSPPNTHRAAALAAISAGKHVICEKPMAINEAEALEMTDAAESSGLLCLIDHELRFNPSRLELKRRIDHGYVGTIRHVTVTYRSGFRAGPGRFNWWSTTEAGGGVLGAIGSHAIDALRWCVGEVEELDCRLATYVAERPDAEGVPRRVGSDDFASVRLVLAGGVIAEMSLSSVARLDNENRIEIVGTDGCLVLDDDRFTLTGWRDGARKDLSVSDPLAGLDGVVDNVWSRAWVHFARKVIGALQAGRNTVEGAATFRDGYEVQRVLDAARLSDGKRAVARLRR